MAFVNTNSYENAPLLAGAADLPVIFYSHGFMSFAGQNTAMMEELASHGYGVYSIQHTYEAAASVFPDGETVKPDPAILKGLSEEFGGEDAIQAYKEAYGGETFGIRRNSRIRIRDKAVARGDRLATRSAPIWVADRIFVHDALERGDAPEAVADVAGAVISGMSVKSACLSAAPLPRGYAWRTGGARRRSIWTAAIFTRR